MKKYALINVFLNLLISNFVFSGNAQNIEHINESEARLRQEIDNGYTSGMNSLGLLSDEKADALVAKGQTQAAEELFKEAEQWYRMAADKGHTSAMFNLGRLLGGKADALLAKGQTQEAEWLFKEAEKWYQKAADKGHTRAISNLGILLEKRQIKKGKIDETKDLWRQFITETYTFVASFFFSVLRGVRDRVDS